MTSAVAEAIQSAQFVVGRDGRQTGVLLDMAAWETLLTWLEDQEDRDLALEYLARRGQAASPETMGLTPWEEVEAELDALEGAGHAGMG